MDHYKLVAMEDLTDAQTREALEQPERFRSAACSRNGAGQPAPSI